MAALILIAPDRVRRAAAVDGNGFRPPWSLTQHLSKSEGVNFVMHDSRIHSFTHPFVHSLTHSFLQQILAEHEVCGKGCTGHRRQRKDTRPVPSTIPAEWEAWFYKHIVAIHSKGPEEAGARCRGPQSQA